MKIPYTLNTFTYKQTLNCKIEADVFIPLDRKENRTAFLYFHGGAFMMGNRIDGLQPALRNALLEKGFVVISADYRLAPETKLNDIIEDARDALLWTQEQADILHIDPYSVIIAGGSAGGFLALNTGFNVAVLPKKIISISAPTGFFPTNIPMGNRSLLKKDSIYGIVETCISFADYEQRAALFTYLLENNLFLYELFGFDPAKNPEQIYPFKIDRNYHSSYPPTLLLHAENDVQVALQEALDLVTFFESKNHYHKYVQYKTGHSSTLLVDNPDSIDEIVRFSLEE